MGRTFLVEGVSGTGKTTVAEELERRGFHVVHGDRELAYQGDPVTGVPTDTSSHENHIWDVAKVRAIVDDPAHDVTFLCGGSRNHAAFLGLLDGVVVLTVDADTLVRRLDQRDLDEFGHTPEERALVLRLHATQEDVPEGVAVDATRAPADVVDEILRVTGVSPPGRPSSPSRSS